MPVSSSVLLFACAGAFAQKPDGQRVPLVAIVGIGDLSRQPLASLVEGLRAAGYEAGKQYPMIVAIYEKQSQGIHRYARLSERDMYSPGVFTALGYFVYLPDIVFRPREPGRSIVECVEAAVRKVLEKGVVDPRRIGLTGHSWGGYTASPFQGR